MVADASARATHSAPMKWISTRGTLLGTVTMEAGRYWRVLEELDRLGFSQFVVDTEFNRRVRAFWPSDPTGPSP